MKSWWSAYSDLTWDKQILCLAAGLALIPAAFVWLRPEPAPTPVRTTAGDVTTHIPKGFVLVPIEVQNYEALDSILGRFGVVDLYQGGGAEQGAQRLVARNVRMLRAPHNPSHFAVLIPDAEARGVLRQTGPFTVIVKRPLESGTEFVKEPARAKRSITYEGG